MQNEITIPPIQEIEVQVSSVKQTASELKVEDQKSMNLAADYLRNISQAEKYIIEKKEEVTKPLMQSLASVRDLFRPFENTLIDAKKTIKAKMLAWQVSEDERIEKEKERIAARVEKGTMRVDTAATKLEAVDSNKSKASIRTVKKIRIVQESAIPRTYLMPNMQKITEDILRYGITILGVETYNEKTIIGR